ncbi:hypothetical protein PFISCL1PPCAC_24331, partial [Pristionchus fissidentatus]
HSCDQSNIATRNSWMNCPQPVTLDLEDVPVRNCTIRRTITDRSALFASRDGHLTFPDEAGAATGAQRRI